MLEHLLATLGMDADRIGAIEQSITEHSDRCVRVRVDRKVESLPWPTEIVPWNDSGRWLLDGTQRPSQTANYVASDYFIQDAGSLLALALLQPLQSERICDLCAAPGGKSSAILESLGHEGMLLANEPIRSRVNVLEWSLSRVGNPRFALSNQDPDRLAPAWPQFFDAILVDAPCSGQTLIGRGKRNENAFAESQIQHSAARQRRILSAAISMLKPGGKLIYSTCTFAIEENEAQIQWLQESFPDAWEPIEPQSLSTWRSPIAAGCYRLWPDRDRCAGSFAGGLRLVGELPETVYSSGHGETKRSFSKSAPHGGKNRRRDTQSEETKALANIGLLHDLILERAGSNIAAVPLDLEWLRDHDQIQRPTLASLTGSNAIPNHLLAMMPPEYFHPHRKMEVDEESALRFARGEPLPPSGTGDGWTVATWNGQALGWLKQIGMRTNNYYPKIGRIN